MSKIFLGLVHYPVYNKKLETITTSITNLDIHDIARSAATYNLERYYLIHPLEPQQALAQDIIGYWQQGFGAAYNPDRQKALELVALRESIEEVQAEIQSEFKGELFTIATDARIYSNTVSYLKLRADIEQAESANYLLLFGTGWGMTRETMSRCDYILEPIRGAGSYNHLSVRSAAAIILDRLLGENWWK